MGATCIWSIAAVLLTILLTSIVPALKSSCSVSTDLVMLTIISIAIARAGRAGLVAPVLSSPNCLLRGYRFIWLGAYTWYRGRGPVHTLSASE